MGSHEIQRPILRNPQYMQLSEVHQLIRPEEDTRCSADPLLKYDMYTLRNLLCLGTLQKNSTLFQNTLEETLK